jgi:transposase
MDQGGSPEQLGIHIGSEETGPRIATILSILETCCRLELPIRDYLAPMLAGLADLPVKPVKRVPELMPTHWAARS